MGNLDVGTLGVVLCFVYLVNAIVSILMVGAGRAFPGAWLWVAAQGTMALGALFMVLRPWVPLWVPVVLGNGTYILACFFFAHSLWTFRRGRGFPWGLYTLAGLAYGIFWAVLGQSFSLRVIVYSLLGGAGALWAAMLLLRKVEKPYRSASFLAALPFVLTALASLVRLVSNWGGDSANDYDHQVVANVAFLLGSVVISSLTLVGYFMLTGIRVEQVMALKDDEIEARNRKLLVSARAKDLFFSIIAHDLRGPIGGSARYVRKHLLGKMTGLETKYSEVETLASALDKTHEFLEKLLWWSRAQLQDWVPTQVPIDLGAVFHQTLSLVRSAAEMKEIEIHLAPPPYPSPIADPESVQLILGNLVSNAVKFSLPGRAIHITVETRELLCLVTVSDEGVGMDPQTLDRLFRIEDKLTSHGTSGERGSGLGLILAQSLAERNNGGITITSQPGKGTQATLWLSVSATD